MTDKLVVVTTGEIVAMVVFAVSILGGVGGSVGYLMFGGWRGTFTVWIGFVAVIVAIAATITICTWLGLGPQVKS